MMANTFSILLALATLITGIFWFAYHIHRKSKKATSSVNDTQTENVNVKKKTKKPENWIESVSSLFPVFAIVFVFRSFIYEPFQIPSGSMMPTLLIGDFILVEKFSYGIKDPIWNTTLIKTGAPSRGDVVVFKYPKNPRVDYIKRVVGLPGDKVVYDTNTKVLTIYPNCETGECTTQELVLQYTPPVESDYSQVIDFNNYSSQFFTSKKLPQITQDQLKIPLLVRDETLGKKEHQIFIQPSVDHNSNGYYRQNYLPIGEWIVPKGQYFVMGDNRDNSEDSRFWGFVPEKNLVGRASAIWFSLEKQSGEWPTGFRLQRISSIH